MVRFLVLYEPPDDPGAFDRHYRDIHIPLAKKLPGLRRYSVSRNIAPVRGADPYYLVAELDWDDMDALRRAFASPEGQATAQDVPKFAGHRVRSLVYEVEEV
ncbi:MAG: EthD family reductase [Streptosporangiaceae bacterium]